MAEEAPIRLDRNVNKPCFTQKFTIPMRRVSPVEVVGFLVKTGSQRRREDEPPAGPENPGRLAHRPDGIWDVFEDLGAESNVERTIGHRKIANVADVINGRIRITSA